MTKRTRVQCLVLAVALLLCAPARVFAASAAQWQADLQYMASELQTTHPNLFFQVSAQDFNAAVNALNQQIPQLSDAQITVGMMKIAALVGDAHTNVWSPFNPLPIGLRWFSDGLFVVSAAQDYQKALGAKVVQIGGMTADQAYAAVSTVISHENDPWVREVSSSYLATPEILYSLGITPAVGSAHYVLQDMTGAQFGLDIAPSSSPIVKAPDPTTGFVPQWTQNQDQFYWYQYLASTNLIYLAYNQCENMPGLSFSSFLNQMAAVAQQQPVTGLVLDLRNNDGGSSDVIQPLFDLLTNYGNLQGKVTVVIGRRTMSSGVMNAITLADTFGALLVGEPTGGKPNAYGQNTHFSLPNSGLTVSCSTKFFNLRPNNDTASLMPDVTVTMSSADYFARHDPFLLAALALPVRYQAPQPGSGSVATVSSASFGSPVSPGALATVFGSFTGFSSAQATSLPLGTQLSGVQVTVNGVAAPLLGVWPSQINFQVPFETLAGSAQIAISAPGQALATGTMQVVNSSPGIFLADFQSLDRPGVVLTGITQQLIGPSLRAARNSVITIYGTGAGLLTETVEDGAGAPLSPLAETTRDPRVFIGSEEAAVTFSGLTPGLVGLWQINAQVPDIATITGQVPVAIVAPGGYGSNAVTIWVE